MPIEHVDVIFAADRDPHLAAVRRKEASYGERPTYETCFTAFAAVSMNKTTITANLLQPIANELRRKARPI